MITASVLAVTYCLLCLAVCARGAHTTWDASTFDGLQKQGGGHYFLKFFSGEVTSWELRERRPRFWGETRLPRKKFGSVHNMQWTFFWLAGLLTDLLTYCGAYFSPPHHRDRPTHTFLDSLAVDGHVWLVPIIRTVSAKIFVLPQRLFLEHRVLFIFLLLQLENAMVRDP